LFIHHSALNKVSSVAVRRWPRY